MVRLAQVACLACSALAAIAAPAGGALAQTRAACEAGIAALREALAQPQEPARRATLDRALRDASRDLAARDHDDCLRATRRADIAPQHGSAPLVANAAASGGEGRLPAGTDPADETPEEDERVQPDRGLPIGVEGASVPERGEVSLRFGFGYNNLRRAAGVPASSDDDDDQGGGERRFGRDLYVPEGELEVGLGHGLSASFEAAYGFGNAEDATNGEAAFSLKWNLLPARGLRPALSVSAGYVQPFGPRHGSGGTLLSLFASQPLASGGNVPYLHANLTWFHAVDRQEEERSDRYAAAVGLALPVTESTGLLLGYAWEQLEEHRRVDQFVELGLRQMLPNAFLLGIGLGVGVGNSQSDYRLLVGLQKAF